jgi:Protein-tyrosine-phosphatase-like, N-terminal domain
MLPPETIKRFVDESVAQLSSARIHQFVPLLVRRLARERLLATATSPLPDGTPHPG